MLKVEIGNRIRVLIGTMSQTEFARQCEISPQALNNYVNGLHYPPMEFMLVLAVKRKVNLHWLIMGEGEVYVNEQKNLEIVNALPELLEMKKATNQFMDRVAESIAEYRVKSQELREKKKNKK